MASHMDASANTATEHSASETATTDPIDEHLQSALECAENDDARYHLREALQLQIAAMENV